MIEKGKETIMQENLPKILVISHTPFAASDSMGSTLASYFGTYELDKIAQFYIKNKTPDMPVCKNYYRVTDSEILRKLLHPFSCRIGRKIELLKEEQGKEIKPVKDVTVSRKNRALGLLLRNLLWQTNIWYNSNFKKWLLEFSPDIILLQPGDFSYLFKLATRLSKKLNIPLVIHQSESYYLKPYISKSPDYLLYRYDFKKSFEKAMKRASLCIYLCDALEKDYANFFDTPSVTIYKSTSLVPEVSEKEFDKNNVKFIYGGNLGEAVGRCEPLLEIGRAVKENGFYIDVYTASTGNHMRELTEENGIRLHSAISNDELQRKIKESDFIIHIENQDKKHIEDLKYAFSTKIADMLASGVCSIVYGSCEIAGIKYFAENELACVIEEKQDLALKIRELIEDKSLRCGYVQRACEFAKKNHNPIENSDKTKEKLKDIYITDKDEEV